MTNEEKAEMIAGQCKPCTNDFYNGVYQGVLIALNAESSVMPSLLPCGEVGCQNPHERAYRGCNICKFKKQRV